MVKLQLRLDETQTNDILGALSVAIDRVDAGAQVDRYVRLRAWLTWRRDKLFGPSRDGLDTANAEFALSQLHDKLSS